QDFARDGAQPHFGRTTLARRGEMPARFGVAAVLTLERVSVGTSPKAGSLGQLIDGAANLAFARRIVVNRGMMRRLSKQPWRIAVPISGSSLVNCGYVGDVLLRCRLGNNIGLALLPQDGSKVAQGLADFDQSRVQ